MSVLYRIDWHEKLHARDADHRLRSWLWEDEETRARYFPEPAHLFSWVWWKNTVKTTHIIGNAGYEYRWKHVDIAGIAQVSDELQKPPTGHIIYTTTAMALFTGDKFQHEVDKQIRRTSPFCMRVHANFGCGYRDRILEWDCLRVFKRLSEDAILVPFSFSLKDVVDYLSMPRGKYKIVCEGVGHGS